MLFIVNELSLGECIKFENSYFDYKVESNDCGPVEREND